MSGAPALPPPQGAALLELYDRALPQVYGYLRARCPSDVAAEDLTAETFLAAVAAIRADRVEALTVAWLIGVARHKLVDHWRREEREHRRVAAVAAEPDRGPGTDPEDEDLDLVRAREVLAGLGAHHRGALTLRYVDGLSVPEVAEALGRSVHATEALLVRARRAFRRAYGQRSSDGA